MGSFSLRNFRQILFFIVFLAILVAPSRNGLPSIQEALPPESRMFSQSPVTAAARAALLTPPEYERLFNRRYSGHDKRVQAYNELLLNVFDGIVFPNVLRGREGWLFWSGEGNIDDYQNAYPFKPQDLEEITQKLGTVQAKLESVGIPFLVVVAPNKETIYPEFLPPGIEKIGERSRLDQLLAYLQENDSPVRVLDLRSRLVAEKAVCRVYYATDTHWNDSGAYFAYAEIISALQADLPQLQAARLEDFHVERETLSGDLARLLLTNPLPTEETLRLVPNHPRRARFLQKIDRTITITQVDDVTLPRALIFRDSFANSLEPYLAEHFSRAVYPWSVSIDFELVREEKPDMVIYELAERYLHRLKEILNPAF